METNWAEENLQTIRTLMERSAIYRRALAPIMLFAGIMGLLTMGLGLFFHMDSTREFFGLWLGAAILAVAGALFLARRQALKDREAFWSPPTRRVTQALLPPLLVGLCLTMLLVSINTDEDLQLDLVFALIWILFYGLALHAAGFFMPRGIKIFGWLFIASACGLYCAFMAEWVHNTDFSSHWLMGFFFGVLHLAYGVYLYLTENRKKAA
jgi:hypothetical protein